MAFKPDGTRARGSKRLALFLAAALCLVGALMTSCYQQHKDVPQDDGSDKQYATGQDSTSDIFVVNAWGKEGLAGDVKDILLAQGFEDIDAGNAVMDSYPESTVLYAGDDDLDRAQRISELLGIAAVEQLDEGTTWREPFDRGIPRLGLLREGRRLAAPCDITTFDRLIPARRRPHTVPPRNLARSGAAYSADERFP